MRGVEFSVKFVTDRSPHPAQKTHNLVRLFLSIAGAEPGFLERGFIYVKVWGSLC